MSDLNSSCAGENPCRKSTDASSQDDDVSPQNGACAAAPTKLTEEDAAVAPPLPKKRKTRRGKSKRKAPYQKFGRKNGKIIKPRIVKPEAPHNDNQFLFEDHGGFEGLDEKLKNIDQLSTASLTRTRDSSLSVDSDGEEFYSSPDDEGEFLMQDFNDQYQSIQTEQLQTMSKQELIDEYLALDNRNSQKEDTIRQLEQELAKHSNEKKGLLEEIDSLHNKLEQLERAVQNQNGHMDSEDSETDSSDSGSSSSSSSSDSSRSITPEADYGATTNGHLSPPGVNTV